MHRRLHIFALDRWFYCRPQNPKINPVHAQKHSWKYLLVNQEYHNKTRVSEDMDLENKAIMDRRYDHTHEFGQWIHSKREVERGIMMCVCVCCVYLIAHL